MRAYAPDALRCAFVLTPGAQLPVKEAIAHLARWGRDNGVATPRRADWAQACKAAGVTEYEGPGRVRMLSGLEKRMPRAAGWWPTDE